MAQTIYNIYQAKAAFSRLVERAAEGEEIVIAKAGQPMALLVPIRATRRRRQPGGWEGQVHIAEDFDAPLPPELQRLFDAEVPERSRLDGESE
jgi:prevent-host-death family protein